MKTSPRDPVIPANVRLLARVRVILRRAKRTHAPTAIVKRKLKQLRGLAHKARRHAYDSLKFVGVSHKQADTYVKTFEEEQREREAAKALRPVIPRVRADLRLIKALKEIMPAEKLAVWLRKPNRALGGQPPAALIRSGKRAALWKMIRQIRNGTFF